MPVQPFELFSPMHYRIVQYGKGISCQYGFRKAFAQIDCSTPDVINQVDPIIGSKKNIGLASIPSPRLLNRNL